MLTKNLINFNSILVDRVRLAIMASLTIKNEPIDFTTLLEDLELSKGNLSTHLSKLEEAGFILVTKAFVGKKPKTTYQYTEKGKQELEAYLTTIEALLKNMQ